MMREMAMPDGDTGTRRDFAGLRASRARHVDYDFHICKMAPFMMFSSNAYIFSLRPSWSFCDAARC